MNFKYDRIIYIILNVFEIFFFLRYGKVYNI